MKTTIKFLVLTLMLMPTLILANSGDSLDTYYFNKSGDYHLIEHANIFTHKHVLKFGVAYCREQGYVNDLFRSFDPNREIFECQKFSPVYSFRHEIYLDNIFSMAYSAGFRKSEVKMNNDVIQTFQANLFVHGKLNYCNRKNVEAYAQLNIGVGYNDMNKENIGDDALERNLTPTFKMYTGFTPLGLNFRLNENVWFNMEASLWSYEALSFGLKIKLKENNMHPGNWAGID